MTHLTEDDVNLAVSILSGWNEKLTWEDFINVFAAARGKTISRQAIAKNHPRIVGAFEDAKTRDRKTRHILNAKSGVVRHGDVALALEVEKNRRLQNEIETLKRENNDLLEQFLRWQYNAEAKGVSREILDLPLPPRKTKHERITYKKRQPRKNEEKQKV